VDPPRVRAKLIETGQVNLSLSPTGESPDHGPARKRILSRTRWRRWTERDALSAGRTPEIIRRHQAACREGWAASNRSW